MSKDSLKFHNVVIGCAMNKSDAERISGYMQMLGFMETDVRKEADIVFITTCGVRQASEDRIYGLIPEIREQNPNVKIVLTGCLSEEKNVRRRLKDVVDVWLPITQLQGLAEQLSKFSIFNDQFSINDQLLNFQKDNYLSFVPDYKSGFSALVPIGNGCDNFCSYCFVPYARGRETYRPAEEILAEVESLVKKGYKEIMLIAQNVNSYKSIVDLRFASDDLVKIIENRKSKIENKALLNFSDLLRIANSINGKYWLRFATSHPKDMSDELIRTIAECDKVCRLIHLPVQAGDDEVLHNMNRKYTRDHYLGLVQKIRAAMPDAAISTDVVIGFPGETPEQFQKTLDLFEEVRFDMVYPGKYSPRPGTVAAKMKDDVSKEDKKAREKQLIEVLKKTARYNNEKFVGQTLEVLVERKSKGKDALVGKDRLGRTITISDSSDISLIGQFVEVIIISAHDFGLDGLLSSRPEPRII